MLTAGDKIRFFSREVGGIYDAFIHGIISFLILFPLCRHFYDYIFAFLFAFLIDIDHFISARSLKISDAINLSTRPVTHSITFAAILGIIFWILFLPSGNRTLPVIVFISLTSHFVKDAKEGITPIFWPARTMKIPYPAYIATEIILFAGMVVISTFWGLPKILTG